MENLKGRPQHIIREYIQDARMKLFREFSRAKGELSKHDPYVPQNPIENFFGGLDYLIEKTVILKVNEPVLAMLEKDSSEEGLLKAFAFVQAERKAEESKGCSSELDSYLKKELLYYYDRTLAAFTGDYRFLGDPHPQGEQVNKVSG